MLTYSTVEGHQFVDHGEIKVAFAQAGKPDAVTYVLKERTYDRFSDQVWPKPTGPGLPHP